MSFVTKCVEKSGKTIDEAINAALAELNTERDKVSVEVLDKPKSGFLGIGSALARVRVSYSMTQKDKAESFLSGLIEKMRVDINFTVSDSDQNRLDVNLFGEKQGVIIGRHGDTLDAIQHITSYVVNKSEDDHVKIIVDSEGYRARREATLERLAQRTAQKVVSYKKNQIMEPMNPYERHVIHTALQEYKNVTTHSVGSEPRRRVVVSYAPNGRPVQSDNLKAPSRPPRQHTPES